MAHRQREFMAGYTDCACRDCFDIAIGAPGSALCLPCQEAGCSAGGDEECQRADAYGVEDEEKPTMKYTIRDRENHLVGGYEDIPLEHAVFLMLRPDRSLSELPVGETTTARGLPAGGRETYWITRTE